MTRLPLIGHHPADIGNIIIKWIDSCKTIEQSNNVHKFIINLPCNENIDMMCLAKLYEKRESLNAKKEEESGNL